MAGDHGPIGGLMFGAQVGQALGKLADEVRHQHRRRPAARPGRRRRARAAERRRRSAPASDGPPTRSGCTSPCARPPTSGCSPTCRGCAQHLLDAVARLRPRHQGRPRGDRARIARRCPRHRTPSDPESIQQAARRAALFEPEETPEQQTALRRLETAARAGRGLGGHRRRRGGRRTACRAPPRWRETMRRRRATGGPPSRPSPPWSGWSCGRGGCARRPRCGPRSREARGTDGRDAVWCHPDLLPGPTTSTTPPATWPGRRSARTTRPLSSARVAAQPSRPGSSVATSAGGAQPPPAGTDHDRRAGRPRAARPARDGVEVDVAASQSGTGSRAARPARRRRRAAPATGRPPAREQLGHHQARDVRHVGGEHRRRRSRRGAASASSARHDVGRVQDGQAGPATSRQARGRAPGGHREGALDRGEVLDRSRRRPRAARGRTPSAVDARRRCVAATRTSRTTATRRGASLRR